MEENLDGPSIEKIDFVKVDIGDLVDLGVKVKVEKCDEDYDQSCRSELAIENIKTEPGEFVNVKTEPGELSDDGTAEDPLEQLYTCVEPGCGKTFSNRFKLEKHQRVHTMCRIPGCFEAFASRKKLAIHERWHLKQMSHPCLVPKCGKAFKAKADLNRHMKVLHKEKRESLVELFQPQTQPPPFPLPPLDSSAEASHNKKMKVSDSESQDEVLHFKEKKLSWPGLDCGSKHSDKTQDKAVKRCAPHFQEDEAKEEYIERLN